MSEISSHFFPEGLMVNIAQNKDGLERILRFGVESVSKRSCTDQQDCAIL